MLDGGEREARSDWTQALTELLLSDDVALRLARAGGGQEEPTDAAVARDAAIAFVTGLLQEEMELAWGDVTTAYPLAALQVLTEHGMGAPEARALLRAGLLAGQLTPAQSAAVAALNRWARELAADKGIALAQQQEAGDVLALVRQSKQWEGMPSAPRRRRRPLLIAWLVIGVIACAGGVWWRTGVRASSVPPQLAAEGTAPTEAVAQIAPAPRPERQPQELRSELEIPPRAEPEPLPAP